MAKKSIARQILMDLKKERKETLKKDTQACLDFMKNRLQILFDQGEKIEEGHTYSFDRGVKLPVSALDFTEITESLGFHTTCTYSEVTFFVPRHEKGEKRTPAQLMIYNFNIEHNKEIAETTQACLDFMKKRVQDIFDVGNGFEEDFRYSIEIIDLPTRTYTFFDTVTPLGFKIEVETPFMYFIIPKYVKGAKRTPAQLMIYNLNIEHNKKIAEAKKLARKEQERVWDSIKSRDFTSTPNKDGTFTITIPLSQERGGKTGDEELKRFLSRRAFPNAIIKNDTLKITLSD